MEKKFPKRRNLSAKDRKKAIVASAATLVEESGWDALNMSALARKAGITRQLIHLHFPTLNELMVETATYLFQTTYMDTRSAVGAYPQASIEEVLSNGLRTTLDLPPGRSKALLKVISTAYSDENELSHFARSMRRLITNIWAPGISKAFDIEISEAKPVAWMLVMAFWGGFHLMDDGDIEKEKVIERFSWMVLKMHEGTHKGDKKK